MNNSKIHIFFSCDDNYIPYLAVAIKSMQENASKDRFYKIDNVIYEKENS